MIVILLKPIIVTKDQYNCKSSYYTKQDADELEDAFDSISKVTSHHHNHDNDNSNDGDKHSINNNNNNHISNNITINVDIINNINGNSNN